MQVLPSCVASSLHFTVEESMLLPPLNNKLVYNCVKTGHRDSTVQCMWPVQLTLLHAVSHTQQIPSPTKLSSDLAVALDSDRSNPDKGCDQLFPSKNRTADTLADACRRLPLLLSHRTGIKGACSVVLSPTRLRSIAREHFILCLAFQHLNLPSPTDIHTTQSTPD